MHNSLRTFKQVPTSASRRVWEGKAGNYSAEWGSLAIPMLFHEKGDELVPSPDQGAANAERLVRFSPIGVFGTSNCK
jgi:hypothetical protein